MKYVRKYFLWLGLLLIALGLAYDFIFVNIPFQDPPPELLKKYLFHKNTSELILYLGVTVLLIGIILRLIRPKII